MSQKRDKPSLADLMRCARAFTMEAMEEDAVRLRPSRPRIRTPITPVAQTIYRALLYRFQNAATGQCDPALRTIAKAAGCAGSSVPRLLPELRWAGYLHWRRGRRRWVRTRRGWRQVGGTNQYRPTCPRDRLPDLRRFLIRAAGGQEGPLIQVVVFRFTPPSEKEQAATQIVAALAHDLRASPARTDHTASSTMPSDPPSQGPPAPQGGVEIAGVRVEDPKLASVLSGLWAALEQREPGEPDTSPKE